MKIPLRNNSLDFDTFAHEVCIPIVMFILIAGLFILFCFLWWPLLFIVLFCVCAWAAYRIDYPRLLGTAEDKEKVLLGRLHKIPEFIQYLIGGVKMAYNTVEISQKLDALVKHLGVTFKKVPEHYAVEKVEEEDAPTASVQDRES